jgi:hypothetical protein
VENSYRFQRLAGANRIIFEIKQDFPVYIEYIQKLTDLTDATDKSVMPSCFDDSIVDYALVEYFRQQRDWGNVSNALQYAE